MYNLRHIRGYAMTIQEKILEILQLDHSKIETSYDNQKDFELNIYSESAGEHRVFAKVFDGNTMHINSVQDEYKKIFEAADKSLYDAILTAYDQNIELLNKYETLIENKRRVVFCIKDPYFYYNKRSKKLYAIPTIKVNTVAAHFQFQFAPSLLSKLDKTIDSVHEQFYSQRLQGFLEKPLNKYTPEELTLFHMVKI